MPSSETVHRSAGQVACKFIHQPEQLKPLTTELSKAERIAIDTETPIDGPSKGQLRVMSIALRSTAGQETVFVIDARDLDPTLLAPHLTDITADAWNADFDAQVIDRAVWQTTNTTTNITWWDAMLADAIIHQGRSGFNWYHGLAWATNHYLGLTAEGKGTTQLSYDSTTDLNAEQIQYAAADALHTMWVGDEIRKQLKSHGLQEVDEIEQNARRFIDQMQRSGINIDWDGWQKELTKLEQRRSEVLTQLALLSGGGQGSLFDSALQPTWNPSSDQQLRLALNTYAASEVEVWTGHKFGQPRQLTMQDTLTSSVLKEIGGELCETLYEYRNLTKILTTYGETIGEHIHQDGRIRPTYLQVVGTNTGRLASRNPNAQNFTPQLKPYLRPASQQRVFVYADLSQAELRYLAQVSGDQTLREAFARGADIHTTTAASMFDVDPAELAAENPTRLKQLRQVAKAINFGIAYGSGANSLAQTLSAEGNPTTRQEAEELLARYRATYPNTHNWAKQRISEIENIAATVSEIDWTLTLKLARGFPTTEQLRRNLRAETMTKPTAVEIAAIHPDRIHKEPDELLDEIEWLLSYSAPVALCKDGQPFRFASNTLAGRRQQFDLHLDRLFLAVALAAISSNESQMQQIRNDFENAHAIELEPAINERQRRVLSEKFRDRQLRRLYVEALIENAGHDKAITYLNQAASERVRAMVNAYRNAPIQGGVADVMLVGYGELDRRLRRYNQTYPVQTVHDSITIECPKELAPEIAEQVRLALETASLHYCPDVCPKIDIDVRQSLSDQDVIIEFD